MSKIILIGAGADLIATVQSRIKALGIDAIIINCDNHSLDALPYLLPPHPETLHEKTRKFCQPFASGTPKLHDRTLINEVLSDEIDRIYGRKKPWTPGENRKEIRDAASAIRKITSKINSKNPKRDVRKRKR